MHSNIVHDMVSVKNGLCLQRKITINLLFSRNLHSSKEFEWFNISSTACHIQLQGECEIGIFVNDLVGTLPQKY